MKDMKKILAGILMIFCFVLAAPGNLPGIQPVLTAEAATVKLNKSTATLEQGKTMQLKISGTKKKVTWSSSDKRIATVSSTGKVTAKKSGTVTITARVNGKVYKCRITVTVPEISEKTVTLTVGDTRTLKITGTNSKVTWTSSSSSVVTVNSKGQITAKKEGTATITAEVSGKKITCKVTVKKAAEKDLSASVTNNVLKMSAYGIHEASMNVKLSSSLHVEQIRYERNVTINGKKADRMVIQCSVQSVFEGSRRFYVVVTGCNSNLHYENTVNVDGYYISTVTVTSDPGMKGTILSTTAAIDAYRSIFSVGIAG